MKWNTSEQYNTWVSLLHWLIGAAIVVQLVFGFLIDDIAPRGTPGRAATINLHKSFGLVLLALIGIRLVVRLATTAPPWPASMSTVQRVAATTSHRLLYVCMLVMPASGYMASNFSKHGLRFFGITLSPWGPDWPSAYNVLSGVHVATAVVLTALIVVHVAAGLHHGLARDGVFERITLRRRRWGSRRRPLSTTS